MAGIRRRDSCGHSVHWILFGFTSFLFNIERGMLGVDGQGPTEYMFAVE